MPAQHVDAVSHLELPQQAVDLQIDGNGRRLAVCFADRVRVYTVAKSDSIGFMADAESHKLDAEMTVSGGSSHSSSSQMISALAWADPSFGCMLAAAGSNSLTVLMETVGRGPDGVATSTFVPVFQEAAEEGGLSCCSFAPKE